MKPQKRILVVSDAWKPQINGVVRTYEHLEIELRRMEHEALVIGPSDFPHRFPIPGYREIELVVMPYRRLAEKIKAFAPDYIHIATEGPLGRAARAYCLRHKLPFITAYHTQFPDYVAQRIAKILPPLAKTVYRLTDHVIRNFHAPAAGIIVTTPTLEHELKERGYTPPLFCMIRGVPTDVFSPGPSPLFKELTRPVALYVGRVAIEKNIEAFLSMNWEGSKIVVGDGPSLESFKRKYPDAVFAGIKTGQDLADHYRAADIFVFPSRTDTFGIVLLEALACGLPVAAYNVTGPRDIITEPYLGVLTNDDLADASNKALHLGDKRNERHEHVREHYSWESAAREFMTILESCSR
jgi:glycosyltransferase involved in cell wall biosynthesis